MKFSAENPRLRKAAKRYATYLKPAEMRLFTFFTLLFMNLSLAQNLEGKWILTTNGDTYIVPKINLFEFKNGIIIISDSEKNLQTNNYKIVGNEIFVENNSFGNFRFVSDNRFTLYKDDEKDAKRNLELDFVRLETTKTDLTESEIEKLTFENKELDILIGFNVELQKPFLIELMKEKATKKMTLKKIDTTLFICNYEAGELNSIIPIKEVNREFIEIYGFSRKEPYYLKINRT
jgi:hypothetical protein